MKLFITIIILLFTVHLSGCSKEPASPQAKGAKNVKKQVQVQAPLPEILKLEEYGYTYDSKGRPDPFASLISAPKEKEKIGRVIGTLEGYDVSDFKLIAIAEKEGHYYALLLSFDNKAFTVREGTVLGLHKGKVAKITDDKVIIIEYVKDYKGKTKPREVVLKLRKGKGEE
ncbi:MAG: pilus assembly protein PilP [Nitrospirae bacterium]|nr:pilus assembly protein PilP [Nitrospirota bacterium]